jgi:hypothetical protein
MPKTFIYEIDVQSNNLNALNYLKAIARYNQKVGIVNIIEDDSDRDPDSFEDKTGKDIPTLVEDAKSQDVKKITFECNRSDSLFAIFPQVSVSDLDLYQDTEAQQKTLSRFYSFNNGMYRLSKPQDIGKLSKEEALNLFTSRELSSAISGAIHFTELNSIVFESDGYCYLLIYGNETSIKHIKDISFNIDHGFMFPYISQYAYSGEAFGELQEYFSVWKDNNYQNDLFSNTMSVNPSNGSSEKKTIQAGRDALFFSSTPSSTMPQNLPLSPKTISVEKMQNESTPNFLQSSIPLSSLDSLQLTHDMIIAASEQKEMSAKIKAVKDILFQTIWLDELVKKFSYSTSNMKYYVSFDRYNRDYDFIDFIKKLVDNICKIGLIKLEPISILYDKSLFQISDVAIEAINQAEVIICVRSKNNVANRYLELEDDAVVEKNAKVIPIILDSQSNEFLPKFLQKTPHLSLHKSDTGLAYSKFFSELLYKMNLLDDKGKLAFDRASEELRKRIDAQYNDEHIAKLIDASDKETENNLRKILGI